MKLLAVSHSCVTDVNQQLYVSLSHLTDTQVDLVVPAVWKNDYSAVLRPAQKLATARFPIHPLPIRFAGNFSFYYYRQGLAGIIHRVQPDVAFVEQEPWSLSMAQMVGLCKRRGIPVVGYAKQNILKSYPLPFRLIERKTYTSAAAIAALSEEARDVLRRKGFTGPCPLLMQGCDLSLFTPRDMQQERKRLGLQEIVIGYMGRLVADKGVATLIEAIRLLREQAPELPVSALIVGSGPEESNLRRQTAEAGLEKQVVFTGAIPHSQAGEYMNCMDIFALPSRTMPRWKEQFGRVIVEALACGVPVVGSDSGEIPHLIEQTQGGLVFKEENAADLMAKLHLLACDPAKRAAFIAAGGQAVRCRYTYDAVALQLRAILESVCGN